MSVWRTQSVPGAAAPLRVAVARGQPLASGTTIRMPPEKAAVFVTVAERRALQAGRRSTLDTPAGAKAALKLWHPPQPGMMVRADINGGGGPLFATPRASSRRVDLTPDAQLHRGHRGARLAGAGDGRRGARLRRDLRAHLGLADTPVFLPLGPLAAPELKPPFELGDLRIQP